jgi:oligopeptide/dipeptide ABC transporter ATP-binding protein
MASRRTPAFELEGSTGLEGLVLEVEDLSVTFPTDDGKVQAVRGVSFELEPGEVLGIVGESGSGKSVTSLALLGLLPKTAVINGSVRFRGRELIGRSEKELMPVRGGSIAMIFQDPLSALNPVYTVGWQISEALMAHQDLSKEESWERSIELLDVVGIPRASERISSYPHEFSGGMRQRVVIAIAIANDPDVIIADEPTTALDVTVQAQVLEALKMAQQRTHAAIILITHDLGVVAGMADRVMVMYAGKTVELAKAEDLYYSPRMPYTQGLLGSLPRLDISGQEKLRPIPGSPPSLLNLPPGCPFVKRCPMARQLCIDEEPALRPVAGADHLSACHFAEELADHESIFSATSGDPEVGSLT